MLIIWKFPKSITSRTAQNVLAGHMWRADCVFETLVYS